MLLEKLIEITSLYILTHELLLVAGVSTLGREFEVDVDLSFWVGYSLPYFISVSGKVGSSALNHLSKTLAGVRSLMLLS
jgi:hypothetical protein